MPTMPHNRLTRWPMTIVGDLKHVCEFEPTLDQQQYYGGPSDLMASLSAQMERERLERVEPRLPGHNYVPSPCPYCDQCKQSCALTCLVCLLGMVVLAVVAMVR